MTSKFNNHKITTEEGVFDSRLEYARWKYLKEAQERGQIRALKRQVEYLLIPKQTRPEMVRLKTKWKMVERIVERPCCYVADFAYQKRMDIYGFTDAECKEYGLVASGWVDVVEDTKGEGRRGRFSTARPDFKIKKKLMLYFLGIRVRIVTKSDELI